MRGRGGGSDGPAARGTGRMSSGHRSAGVLLSTPVNYLKGVGPRRAEALRRLHVVTAEDLL